ncbi:MAG: 3-hydroxyacyl-ACP dehydratase [Gaiellales bacterium]|nr:3-hydroxyacyl-ACP dehydratase [Gaiellales bacterium]
MTRILGLDVGSRTVDAVWWEDGAIADSAVLDSGFDPQEVGARLLARGDHDLVVATGYGRHAVRERFGAEIITEIKAYGTGASRLYPQARSVLDIGGQDTKVISLDGGGRVMDFEMNDKCAAGTGRFLEVMARALGFELSELGPGALTAPEGVKISSMCTVFAESEVIGLVHKGVDRNRIALGLHESIATRTLSMLKRVNAQPPLVFAGGVAKNPAMARLITWGFAGEVLTPTDSQLVGALGAALHGQSLLSGAGSG